MDKGARRATVYRVSRVGHDLATKPNKGRIVEVFERECVFAVAPVIASKLEGA